MSFSGISWSPVNEREEARESQDGRAAERPVHDARWAARRVLVSPRRGGVYVKPFGLSLYVRWCTQQSPNLIRE